MSSASGILRRPAHRLSALFTLLFFATALGSGMMIGMEEERKAPNLRQPKPETWVDQSIPSRRRLGGPGSSPPTCRGRCGRCYPCRPVHVTIQPGQAIPLEYYPEAWRCKCGNKLFVP